MIKKNYRLRWIYLIVGIAGLLYSGCINAFSILMLPIEAEFSDWSKAQVTSVFTVLQSAFCIVGILGGFTAEKISSKKTIIGSAVLYCIGCLAASLTHSHLVFCLTFGILSGAGMGLVYNAVVRTVVRWFPDRAGLASGLLLMGFGIAGFVIGKLYQGLTPEAFGGWRISFRFIGISALIVLFIVSMFILEPSPEDLPESLRSTKAAARPDEFIGNFRPGKMLGNPAFITYYIYGLLLSVVGSTILSQASGIVGETAPMMTAAKVATVVGMMPFANGIGRVVSGYLTDRIRVKKTTFFSCTLFILASGIFLLALLSKSPVLLVAGFLVSGLTYGSLGTLNSAFAATRFGLDFYGINFAILNTGGIFASILATLISSLYDKTQTYLYPLLVILFAGISAFILRIFLFRYEKKMHCTP